MAYNSLNFKLFISIFGLIIFASLAVFSFSSDNYILFAVFTTVLVFVLFYIWHLIASVETKLHNFFFQLKENDKNFKIDFNPSADVFKQFGSLSDEILHLTRDAKIEKENQFNYLQYVVENAGTGLIAYDETGKIDLINKTARNLLGINSLVNIKNFAEFYTFLVELKPAQQKLFSLNINNQIVQLSVKSMFLKLREKPLTLVSIQDIKNELDEKELESWQKLIRILTHEIMNSITPITTLSSTINNYLKKSQSGDSDRLTAEEYINEAITGLSLIENRSAGLIDFVNNYRSLTANISPNFSELSLVKIFSEMQLLFANDFRENGISFSCECKPENLQIYADEKLISQVLINLIKNAVQAISNQEEKTITIAAQISDGKKVISITDSGCGIEKENLENIFIPFFTTKKGGSGVGLSLSRQIIRAHRGTIKVKSQAGKGTSFIIEL